MQPLITPVSDHHLGLPTLIGNNQCYIDSHISSGREGKHFQEQDPQAVAEEDSKLWCGCFGCLGVLKILYRL